MNSLAKAQAIAVRSSTTCSFYIFKIDIARAHYKGRLLLRNEFEHSVLNRDLAMSKLINDRKETLNSARNGIMIAIVSSRWSFREIFRMEESH